MIITAAGSSRHPLGFGRNPLLGLSDAESKLLAESIYGDIGGVLLPHRTNPPGKPGQCLGDRLVAGITRRWTGLGSDLEEALAKALLDAEADGREALPIARTDKRQRHNP